MHFSLVVIDILVAAGAEPMDGAEYRVYSFDHIDLVS
jgi:hypothetical protein